MKLSAYVVLVDSGFSPNPFWGRCTLACCKPTVRRLAAPGDIIVGSGSRKAGLSGRLIYAMRVGEVLPYEIYWRRFPSKRPSTQSEITRRGDNIWHPVDGQWVGVEGALHDRRHRARDLRGQYVLVSDEFYYFGRGAPLVPIGLQKVLAKTQGHRNTRDPQLIRRFWSWVRRTGGQPGRSGMPSEFSELGCNAQRSLRESA